MLGIWFISCALFRSTVMVKRMKFYRLRTELFRRTWIKTRHPPPQPTTRRPVGASSLRIRPEGGSTRMRTKKTLLVISTLLVGSSLMFAGTVSGKVTYTGTPAKQKPIDMSKEPSCAKQHATPITTETVVTGSNNALENVVVYVSSGAADEGQVPSQTLTYTQKGCQYIPHVLPMHVNQEFEIVNADQTSHNIHPLPKV